MDTLAGAANGAATFSANTQRILDRIERSVERLSQLDERCKNGPQPPSPQPGASPVFSPSLTGVTDRLNTLADRLDNVSDNLNNIA